MKEISISLSQDEYIKMEKIIKDISPFYIKIKIDYEIVFTDIDKAIYFLDKLKEIRYSF